MAGVAGRQRSPPTPPPPDPGADDDRDGHTNLGEWLHTQAGEVEGGERGRRLGRQADRSAEGSMKSVR